MIENLQTGLALMLKCRNSAKNMKEKLVLEIRFFGLIVAAIWKKFMKLANLVKNAKMENAKKYERQMQQKNATKTKYIGLTAAAKKVLYIMTAEKIYLGTNAEMGSAAFFGEAFARRRRNQIRKMEKINKANSTYL